MNLSDLLEAFNSKPNTDLTFADLAHDLIPRGCGSRTRELTEKLGTMLQQGVRNGFIVMTDGVPPTYRLIAY